MDRDSAQIDWFDPRAGLFGADYLQEYGAISQGHTNREVDFVVRQLELPPASRILDLACGHGRHSLELARRGFAVTGQDLSPTFLEAAERQARQENLKIEWTCRDMRDVSYSVQFHAVLCLFSSFGYLPTDDDDQKVLDGIALALEPGGRLLLDVRNRDRILQNYRSTRRDEFPNGTVLTSTSSFDLITGRNTENYLRQTADGRSQSMVASVRLYTPPELNSMLRRAGLALRTVFGSYDSSAFTLDSKCCLVLAQKM